MSVNVLQVCYVYPPSFSGYGKQLETVNSFFDKDDDVYIDIITAYNGNSKSNVYSFHNKSRKIISKEKIDYYAFAFLSPFKFFRKFLKCDVVHIVKAGPEIIIWTLLSKLFGKKVIVKVAQDEVEDHKPINFFRRFRYRCLKLSDVVIALSSKIENELKNIGVNHSSVVRINNSFKIINNNENFSILNIDENIKDTFVISFVGSLCRRKGVDDLLESLVYYNNNKRISLLLIGPNYGDISNLKELVDKVNLNEMCSVYVLGERVDAKNIISKSNLLCLPSYSEGMPNVVIEALSFGVPVLASNIPVIYDMINITNGKIHKVGDSTDILSKINEILVHEYNYSKIRDDARLNYSVVNIGEKYKKLYLDLGSE
ncbi:glycosyltransferase family 4 protein [Vibrio kanaloae]|uniref:glycosyltransferase family 4 protein n=1 Tax=Vibrio kanaloae TaxID=170673 RepID=UPI0010BEF799|nr:glycosyltransferase family 4 protein [Vibrio kanaloae]TKF80562.1 glycosyltransferase family 4 protein [Vibrio kanaloae]